MCVILCVKSMIFTVNRFISYSGSINTFLITIYSSRTRASFADVVTLDLEIFLQVKHHRVIKTWLQLLFNSGIYLTLFMKIICSSWLKPCNNLLKLLINLKPQRFPSSPKDHCYDLFESLDGSRG